MTKLILYINKYSIIGAIIAYQTYPKKYQLNNKIISTNPLLIPQVLVSQNV